jgi:hypothetical protein
MWTVITIIAIIIAIYFSRKKENKEDYTKTYTSRVTSRLYDYENELANNFYSFIQTSNRDEIKKGIEVIAGNIYSYAILRLEDKKIINYFMNNEDYANTAKNAITTGLMKKLDDNSLYQMSKADVQSEILDWIMDTKAISEKMGYIAAMRIRR